MNPDKIAELRIKMENELELLFNQAQRRGSARPSPSQIVDCMFNAAVEFIMAAVQPGARNRK
jgi:hypothetical protein